MSLSLRLQYETQKCYCATGIAVLSMQRGYPFAKPTSTTSLPQNIQVETKLLEGRLVKYFFFNFFEWSVDPFSRFEVKFSNDEHL